jgi:hypothetical protein
MENKAVRIEQYPYLITLCRKEQLLKISQNNARMKLSTNLICASGEQPTDDRPTRNDVRAEEFVGRVDDSDYEPNKIAAKRLRLWC